MFRQIFALILIVLLAFFLGYTTREFNVLETFIPKQEEPTTVDFVDKPAPSNSAPENSNGINIDSTTYDFISFASEHVLDIEPMLQLPDYPTGCETVSLTMLLRYVTGNEIDPGDIIDNYLPMSTEGNFVSAFTGNPRDVMGGGCYPPAIVTTANNYFADDEVRLFALDATGINAEQIKHYIDNGFPVLMWTTMYQDEPTLHNIFYEYNDRRYQWYTSEHCVLVKGYNPESNRFIINDPLIGEIEIDIDEFMEISDTIGNLAAIVL